MPVNTYYLDVACETTQPGNVRGRRWGTRNVRSSQRDTEERYIQNYFSDSTLKNDKLTDARQKSFELAAKDLKGRFESRFNTYG